MPEEQAPQIPETQPKRNLLGIPIAIVIAAALISGAIFFSGQNAQPNTQAANVGNTQNEQVTPEITVDPVTEADHIRGNPNAPILLVEYSDYDCPFCKNFHETMNQIMLDYGVDGSVAWVYRHFPLEQLHPNAPKLAAAAECAAELGGNEAFWEFSDLIFGERKQNEATDITRLGEFATKAGIDKSKFELCLNSGKYDDAIAEDVQKAIAAGGKGTPYTVVLVGDKRGVISGAQPYNVVKQAVDNLLKQMEGGEPAEPAPAE